MNFNQFLLILKARHKIILVAFFVTVLSALILSLMMSKTYSAETSLLLNNSGIDPVSGQATPAQLLPGYMATQVEIIASRNVATKVVRDLKLIDLPDIQEGFQKEAKGEGDIRIWVADKLLKKLDVKPSTESSVITISYKDSDPQIVAKVANAFASAYQLMNIQLKADPAKKAAVFLGEQSSVLRKKLEESQAKLSKYQLERGVTTAAGYLDVESARLNELSTQLVAAQSLSFDAASRQQRTRGDAEESPDIAASPVVQSLKIEISRAEAKFSDLAQRIGPSHPQYQAAKAELANLKNKLMEEAGKAGSSVRGNSRIQLQREAGLRAALAAQKARVLNLNSSKDELSMLQRDVENAQKALDVTSQRFSQTSIEGSAAQSDVEILNIATPPQKPTSPKLMLNLVLAIVLGLIIGLGFALLAEALDRRVRTSEDVSELLDLPVFAVINNQFASRNQQIKAPLLKLTKAL